MKPLRQWKNELNFEVLRNTDQIEIKAYNIQFDNSEDCHNRCNLTLLIGDGSKTIPAPAIYITNTSVSSWTLT